MGPRVHDRICRILREIKDPQGPNGWKELRALAEADGSPLRSFQFAQVEVRARFARENDRLWLMLLVDQRGWPVPAEACAGVLLLSSEGQPADWIRLSWSTREGMLLGRILEEPVADGTRMTILANSESSDPVVSCRIDQKQRPPRGGIINEEAQILIRSGGLELRIPKRK